MSIGKSIFRGSVWMVLLNLMVRLIGVVSTIVLARLLVPEDFGIIAMAMSVIAIAELLTGFGFDSALIQRQDAKREYYDTVWTLKICLGLLISTLVALAAVPAGVFYSDPRVVLVMFCLAPMSFIDSMENVGVVDFRKHMQFSKEFRFNLSKRLVMFFTTMTFVVFVRSYWALVAGMLVGRIAGVMFSYWLHPFRPRLCLSAGKDLFNFSGWIFLNGLIGAVSLRLPHFLIGRLHGASSLGLYSIASEVSLLPATGISAPINRAAFPGYSIMSADPDALRKGYIDVLSAVALLIIPAGLGLSSIAAPIVEVMFGSNWTAAAPIVEVLALSTGLAALTSGNFYVYLARGMTHVPPIIGVFHAIVFLLSLWVWLSDRDVLGVAISELCATAGSACLGTWILTATTRVTLADWLRAIWRPSISALMMYACLASIKPWMAEHASALVEVLSLTITGALVYGTGILLLWRFSGSPIGPEQAVIEKGKAWWLSRSSEN